MTDPAPTPHLRLQPIAANRRTWADIMNTNLSLIDAVMGTYFSIQNLLGAWQNSTAYAVNDAVVDEDTAIVVRCLIAHTSASIPTTFLQDRIANPSYWEVYSSPARSRGVWMVNTFYSLNDFVVSGSQYAICVEAHTSGATFAADASLGKWSILVDLSAVGQAVLPVPGGLADANKFTGLNAAGTGYTNFSAADALNNLGATSLGKALLAATSQTGARTEINAQVAGDYQPHSTVLDDLVSSPIGAFGLGSVNTLAELKALTARPAVVVMAGHLVAGDKGGRTWYWEAGASDPVNDIDIVSPTSGAGGRYKALYDGPLHIEWGGAVGAGYHHVAVQAVLDRAEVLETSVTMFPGNVIDLNAELQCSVPFDMRGGELRQNLKHTGVFTLDSYGAVSNGKWTGMVQIAYDIASITRGATTTIVNTAANDYVNTNPIYFSNIVGMEELNEISTAATVVSPTTFTIAVDTRGTSIIDARNNGAGAVRVITSADVSLDDDNEFTVYGVLGTTEANGQHGITIPADKTITGAANNGSGLIRITSVGHGAVTGDFPTIADVGGVPNATGTRQITRITADTFDIVGSTWAGAYTSGGTIEFNRAVDLTGTTFSVPYISGGFITKYNDYVSSGNTTHRPSTNGDGFSGWQRMTGARIIGSHCSVKHIVVENLMSGVCLRGPIVVDSTMETGYDFTQQSIGTEIDGLHCISCDFITTGCSQNGITMRNTSWETPKHRTVPNHQHYWQGATTSRVFIDSIVDNGVGLCRVSTVGSNNLFTTGKKYQVVDAEGVPGALGVFVITEIDNNTFDLVGSTFSGSYIAGTGYVKPPNEGFIDNANVYDLVCKDHHVSEAYKFSNSRFGTFYSPKTKNCAVGSFTVSYGWGNKVIAPDFDEIYHGTYGFRQTDDFGDDNEIIGGTMRGKEGAIFYAVTNAGSGLRLHAKGVKAITDSNASDLSSVIRTFNNASDGSVIFEGCIDEQLQDNGYYSYGNSEGEMDVILPVQRGRAGLLRLGTGSTTRAMVAKALLHDFDAGDSACVQSSGTLTITDAVGEITGTVSGGPTLAGVTVAGAQTYGGASNRIDYKRVGAIVYANVTLRLTAFDAATSGILEIGNLPFNYNGAPGANPDPTVCVDCTVAANLQSLPLTNAPISIRMIDMTKTARIYYITSGATGITKNDLTHLNATNTLQISFAICYPTNDPFP